MKAVILIFKHATFLRLSNLSPRSALNQAEIDYQAANMEWKIQEHLAVPGQEHSVEHFVSFIMATDICVFILKLLRPYFNKLLSVPPHSSAEIHGHQKQHWSDQLWKSIFPHKFIGHHEEACEEGQVNAMSSGLDMV